MNRKRGRVVPSLVVGLALFAVLGAVLPASSAEQRSCTDSGMAVGQGVYVPAFGEVPPNVLNCTTLPPSCYAPNCQADANSSGGAQQGVSGTKVGTNVQVVLETRTYLKILGKYIYASPWQNAAKQICTDAPKIPTSCTTPPAVTTIGTLQQARATCLYSPGPGKATLSAYLYCQVQLTFSD